MRRFRFKAKNMENKIMRGIINCNDVDELREILSHQNYYLVKYSKRREKSSLSSFMGKISVDDLTMFCRQFSIMITAGIELGDAVSHLSRQSKNKKLKQILADVHRHMLEGNTIADSFGLYPKTFPLFFTNMLAIGEASGNMDFVLAKLADYYENDAQIKKKIKNSLTYPKILIVLSLAVLLGLSIFVMPIFTDLFESFDAELPLVTNVVNDISLFVRKNIIFIIAGMVGVVIAFKIFKSTKYGQYVLDYMKLNMPIIKHVTVSSTTARFSNGFGVLINSGAKIIDSLEIIGRLLGNVVVEQKFKIVSSEIKRGQPIARSLNTIDVFPSMLIEMMNVGEESDAIEEVLNKTGGYFDEQVNVAIRKMSSTIEPMFILFIGVMLMVILLAIFVPMMGIMDAIGASVEP